MSTSPLNRWRLAVGSVLVLAATASLALVDDLHTGPVWVHWFGSLVAIGTALAVVMIAELTWQRALRTATADGLVAAA